MMQGAGGAGGLLAMTDDSTGLSCYYAHDGNGNVVGKYKSVGGLCWVGVAVPASSTITITMPSKPAYRGPLLFSDGQSLWGSVDGDGKWTITVTATAALDGYGLYWS